MKTWLWTGHKWRNVSPLEAKYRRDAGFIVVESKSPPKDPPRAKEARLDGGGAPAAFGNAPPADSTEKTSEPKAPAPTPADASKKSGNELA